MSKYDNIEPLTPEERMKILDAFRNLPPRTFTRNYGDWSAILHADGSILLSGGMFGETLLTEENDPIVWGFLNDWIKTS